jgi:hypothetical protein
VHSLAVGNKKGHLQTGGLLHTDNFLYQLRHDDGNSLGQLELAPKAAYGAADEPLQFQPSAPVVVVSGVSSTNMAVHAGLRAAAPVAVVSTSMYITPVIIVSEFT